MAHMATIVDYSLWLAFFRVTEWFMQLEDPTNAQSAFVSVLVGAGAAWFGLYCGTGKRSE